jgi:hypothetical protein
VRIYCSYFLKFFTLILLVNADGMHQILYACAVLAMTFGLQIEAMLKGDWGRLANLPEQMRCRFAAMLPRGPVATMLAGHPVVMKVRANSCHSDNDTAAVCA